MVAGKMLLQGAEKGQGQGDKPNCLWQHRLQGKTEAVVEVK